MFHVPRAKPSVAALPAPVVDGVTVASTTSEPLNLVYFPSSEPMRLALQHFSRGRLSFKRRVVMAVMAGYVKGFG
jgi:hypothetical protein